MSLHERVGVSPTLAAMSATEAPGPVRLVLHGEGQA